jgi:glutathione S-transferase
MSSDLDLYHGLASTCSKKVRLCLYEKELTFKSHLLNLQAFEQHSPEYLKLNPNGVVRPRQGEPTSPMIIEYIDDEFERATASADSLGAREMLWIGSPEKSPRSGSPNG